MKHTIRQRADGKWAVVGPSGQTLIGFAFTAVEARQWAEQGDGILRGLAIAGEATCGGLWMPQAEDIGGVSLGQR